MNISIVVLAHGHPEISNLLAVLASGRTCTLLGVLEVWEFCATLSQEERYLSRLFKVFRIGGRFLHVCITSSLAYHNLTQRRFPFRGIRARDAGWAGRARGPAL